MNGLHLVVGDTEGYGVIFGPLSGPGDQGPPDGRFAVIDAPITIRAETGAWHLRRRSGIEPHALANFRSDLGKMKSAHRGRVFFGDHDFSQIVDLLVDDDQKVLLVANNAAENVFDIEIGELGWADIDRVIDQINEIEQHIGPLTGHCGCGIPGSGYYS